MNRRYLLNTLVCTVLVTGVLAGCERETEAPPTEQAGAAPPPLQATPASDYSPLLTWESRATPESQGKIIEEAGERRQVRYGFGGFGRISQSFDQWPSHGYADTTEYPAPQEVQIPEDIKGDPEKGHELFKNRKKGPCSACHVVQDAEAWPLGNVGPDLRVIGDRSLSDQHLYQLIYDPRTVSGLDTPMPPFGLAGMLNEEEIVHIVSYLQTQKGETPGVPPLVSEDTQWNPNTRDVVRPDYGNPLDPTENPALLVTEEVAVPFWNRKGPKGKSCADAGCHGEIGEWDDLRQIGVIESMVGVAAAYPKWMETYGRMMSIEDFLAVHTPETTGLEMPTQSKENLTMSILVRMQSNGMPYAMDTEHPAVKAAIERGKALFHRPVGQRHHACADCHTERGGANKFLGGRFLANVNDGMINHPYWRTAQQRIWDIRTRMQWCMTPLGTNYLPGDSPEYADLETYIMSRQQGKEVLVPRQAH